MNACVGLHPHGPCPPGVGCNAPPDPVGLRVAELEAEVAEQLQIIQALEDELAEVAALRALVAPARALTVDKDDDDALLDLGGALAALDEGPAYCMSPVATFSGSAPEMCALPDGHNGRCRA